MTKELIKGMTREEWLQVRKTGIGGSDAAAVMGMNPYKSPLSVYVDKTMADLPEETVNIAMECGIAFEGFVAEKFCQQTGKKVLRSNYMYRSGENPFMLANIDRMIVGEKALLECKTTSIFNPIKFSCGDIPPTYYWQCQHYLAVTGYDVCYLAILVLSKDFHVFTIPRNEEHINMLIDEERTFWNEHVLKGIPPLPIGLEADDDAIRQMTGDVDNENVALLDGDEHVVRALAELPGLKTAAEESEQRLNQAKQIIRQAMGEYACATCTDWDITYKEQQSRRIDSKALQAAMPDIYQRFSKVSTSRVLRVKHIDEQRKGA